MMSFNHNLLRMYRARIDMSQSEIAKKANMSHDTYWAMENGKRNNQIKNLIKIIKVLELTDQEILKFIKGE